MKKAILLIGVIALFGCSKKKPELTGWKLEFNNHCANILDDYFDVGQGFKIIERVDFTTSYDDNYECQKNRVEQLEKTENIILIRAIQNEYDECSKKAYEYYKDKTREYPAVQGPVIHSTGVRIKFKNELGKKTIQDFTCRLNHPDGSITPDNFDGTNPRESYFDWLD